jgi:outer membrane protein OmpA-like peptidoglycan-associated protein
VANAAAARSKDPAPGAPNTPAEKFAELRTLLVGPEQRQLRALQTRFDDPVAHAQDVSRVLPTAVELRANDPRLRRALAPTVEEAISSSVRRNPRPLADALFPIIGPAIRKAIAATLSGMLESLNTTLEHSLSWRSLRWRLDARRTGKSFAEIVLLNTLVYRVEQVFLIHRPSGLLLQHITLPGKSVQDGDMVSGMLTAIRDFVQDSFKVSDDEGLQTLKVGELSVWIEQGPHALLAVVVRGSAPPALRATLQQALESMHALHSESLESFDGDASKFESARPLLEECLQQQYQARDGARRSPMLKVVAAILVLALGLWMFFALRARGRWNDYIQALGAEPGIVVVSTGREDGRYVVNGLRDPLARDPSTLLAAHHLEADDVVGRWQLYQALHPSLVLARARQLLGPPSGADLQFDDGVLSAVGAAPVGWIESSARIAPVLPGVTRFDATRPIDAAQKTLTESIEAGAPLFVTGTTRFTVGGEQVVRDQITRLHSLDALGRLGNRRFSVELTGHTDADGPPDANLPLSGQRARHVLALLQAERFERVALRTVGVGSRDAADPSAPEDVKQRNRRVSFRVTSAADGR